MLKEISLSGALGETRMNVKLLAITNPAPGNLPTIEQFIEYCGRVCWRTGLSPEKTERFIKVLIWKAHLSVIEHAVATFEVSNISRSCSHQIVRHRIGSYSQESMRYVEQDILPKIPVSIRNSAEAYNRYIKAAMAAMDVYKAMLDLGIPKEDARYILPIGTPTRLVMTYNFRQWRHFIQLRGASSAQWEIKEVSRRVLVILKEVAPTVFGDLEVQ